MVEAKPVAHMIRRNATVYGHAYLNSAFEKITHLFVPKPEQTYYYVSRAADFICLSNLSHMFFIWICNVMFTY